MKKSCRLAALLLLLTVASVAAQEILWTREYGGEGEDRGMQVEVTADGGFVVCGRTRLAGAADSDLLLMRTEGDGDTLWTRAYGGPADEFGWRLAITTGGGFIVAGESSSFGGGEGDVYLLATDADGDTTWTRTYGGAARDFASSVMQTADGGYFVGGGTRSFGAGQGDVYLLRLDAAGDTLWTRTYGGTGTDEVYSLDLTEDGGCILGGLTNSYGAGNWDVYLLRIDAAGDTLWTRTVGMTDADACHDLVRTADGGFMIVGATWRYGGYDVYLVNVDGAGCTRWTREYGGVYWDYANAVRQTADGGFIIVGAFQPAGMGSEDVWLMRTDAQGDTLWTCTYGRSGRTNYDSGDSVRLTPDGNFIIAGATERIGTELNDVWLLKISGDEPPVGVEDQLDHGGPAGDSSPRLTCPTPSGSHVLASIRLAETGDARLTVFDATGRRVQTLVAADRLPAGRHVTVWDASQRPSGVYFLRLVTGDAVLVRRVTLLK